MAKFTRKSKNHASSFANRFWGKHTHIVLIILLSFSLIALSLINKHFLKEIFILKQLLAGLFIEISRIKEYLKLTII